MENDMQNLQAIFGEELAAAAARAAPAAQPMPDQAVVGGPGRRVEDESESDVLRLLGSIGADVPIATKPVPNVGQASLAAAYAIASGLSKNLVHMVFREMEGKRVSDFRASLTALAQATQPLGKGEVLDGLSSREAIDDLIKNHSAAELLRAMKQRSSKKAIFLTPSSVGGYYLQAMAGMFVKKIPEQDTRSIRVILSNGEHRVIPPVDMMDDAKVNELVGDMRMFLDGAFETTYTRTEWLVRLSLFLHPVVIQGQGLRPLDAASHAAYVRQYVQAPWKVVSDIRGKHEHQLSKMAQVLTTLVNNRISKHVFPEGSSKKQLFASALSAVVVGGVKQFNLLWEKVAPEVSKAGENLKIPDQLDKNIWDATPVPERIKMIANKGWAPVPALRQLDNYRAARKLPILEKMCAFIDQPGCTSDSRVAQQEKIARVLDALRISEFAGENHRKVAIGIDAGYTVPFLSQHGFAFFDRVGKEVYGHTVGQLDVNNALRLGEALKGVRVVLSDVAESSSGSSGSGDDLKRCSFMLNELSFSNLVQQCIVNKVEAIALKSFLPNSAVLNAVFPQAVQMLISAYDIRVVKGGKLHNDEIFYVGRRRVEATPANSPAYMVTVRNLILDYGYVCAMLYSGNQMLMHSFVTGGSGPRWRLRGAQVEYNATAANETWRPATAGEAAVWRYTHDMHPLNMHGVQTLPCFGENRDLYVLDEGDGTDGNVELYKLFGLEVGAAATGAHVLNEAMRVENHPSVEGGGK